MTKTDYENCIDRESQGINLLQMLHQHLIQSNILQKYEIFAPHNNKNTAEPSNFDHENNF